jgi:hypothetical protein
MGASNLGETHKPLDTWQRYNGLFIAIPWNTTRWTPAWWTLTCAHFLGYGSETAEYWFIGTQHGGGSHLAELKARLRAWHERGRRALDDAPAYHAAFDYTAYTRGRRWVGDRAALQPTWSADVGRHC